jgi:hypothetical protein
MAGNRNDLTWRKTTRCDSAACVEVARSNGNVYVRQSNDPDGPFLIIPEDAWEGFLRAVRAGTFDPA